MAMGSGTRFPADRKSIEKASPYGQSAWREKTIGQLGLQSSMREQGSPRKKPQARPAAGA